MKIINKPKTKAARRYRITFFSAKTESGIFTPRHTYDGPPVSPWKLWLVGKLTGWEIVDITPLPDKPCP